MATNPINSAQLISLVDAERYEEALGRAIGDRQPVDVFELKSQFFNDKETLKRIHIAEGKLKNEKAADHLFRMRGISASLADKSQFKVAMPYFERIAQLSNTALDNLNLAAMYLKTKNDARSVKPLLQALAGEEQLPAEVPRGEIDFLLLKEYLRQKNVSKVAFHAEAAVRKGQSSAFVGNMLLRDKQYDLSIRYLKNAADGGRDPHVLFNLAEAYFAAERHGDAEVAYERLLESEASLPQKFHGHAEFMLATICMLQHRDVTEVEEYLRKSANKGYTEAKKAMEAMNKSRSDAEAQSRHHRELAQMAMQLGIRSPNDYERLIRGIEPQPPPPMSWKRAKEGILTKILRFTGLIP